MYDGEVNTVEGIRGFFQYLLEVEEVNFHPDTDFSDYISLDAGEPTFSKPEVAHYESLMNKSFDVCEKEGIDIHDLAMDCLKPKLDIKD